MSEKLLIQEFARIGNTPQSIERLRSFVLDLAVRGKLAERRSGDEPASSLLSRIQRQSKERLGGGSRRKSVQFAPITASEAPFSIPETWIWTRVRQVTRDRGQTIPTSDFTYIDVTAIDKKFGRLGSPVVLSAAEAPSRARKVISRGDVLYSCVRPYLLNIAVVDTDLNPPPIASTAFAVLDGFGLVESRYLWTVLRSSYFVECVEDKMRGQAYPAINDSDFSQLPIPLPPLGEQQRIVAKVEELMALCDQLEAAQKERELQRDELRSVSLHRLTSTQDNATDIATDIHFFLDQSPRLITKPEHLAELRQSILNLAVRGRLLPQDPGEAVSGAVPEILPPLELDVGPNNWRWTAFGSVASISGGFAFKSVDYAPTGTFVLRVTNIRPDGAIDRNAPVFLSNDKVSHKMEQFYLSEGEILLVMVGGSLGKIGVVTKDILPALLNQNLWRINPSNNYIDRKFLRLLVDFIVSFQRTITHSTHGHLSRDQFRKAPVHLPPLPEQHRIVAKVDELLAVCDGLESALASAQNERVRLLEWLLHEALADTTGTMAPA